MALERLVPFDMAQLESPVNADEDLYIDIKSNAPGRHERWLQRRIVGQQATGAVRVESLDGRHSEVIDLADYEWRWRLVSRGAATEVHER